MNELQYQIKEAIARGSGEYDFDLYREVMLMRDDLMLTSQPTTKPKQPAEMEPIRYFLTYRNGYPELSDSCNAALNNTSCYECLIDRDNKQYAIRPSAFEKHPRFFECWERAAKKAAESGIANIKIPTEESTSGNHRVANIRKFLGVEDLDTFEGTFFPEEKIIVFDMAHQFQEATARSKRHKISPQNHRKAAKR